MEIRNFVVNRKNIFMVENHNEVVEFWFSESKKMDKKPALLTFDYHTDTHLAFLRYNYNRLNGAEHSILVNEANKMTRGNFTLDNMQEFVKLLRNDEHIDFAIRAGIISHAYVISYNLGTCTIKSEEMKQWEKENLDIIKIITGQQTPKPNSYNYIMPKNSIIELGKEHFNNMNIYEQKKEMDLSIDDKNLEYRISDIKVINQSIFGKDYDFTENFILDIDLDYFNTLESIKPKNFSVFYDLIRKAQVITIAKESFFIHECKLDKNISPQYLIFNLFKHIRKALN